MQEIRDDLQVIEKLRASSPPTATPFFIGPGITPFPVEITVQLRPGTEVPSGSARITVVGIESDLGPEFGELRSRVGFILEGPHQGGLAQIFGVVDEDGFVCKAGINAEVGAPLLPGEKTRFWIVYQCGEGKRPQTLSLDGINFEFPQEGK